MTAEPPDCTALVVLVPEAERPVGALRARFDSSAALGVPAHVTILDPFVAGTFPDRSHPETP